MKAFVQSIWASNNVHEDIRIRLFLLSLHLEDNLSVRNRFVGLDKGTISSFAELVETLCSNWDSGKHDKWILHVKHARDLLCKESQNKDQVEAAIIQGLTDDVSRMIDEAPK